MLHKLVSHVPERGGALLALANEATRRTPSPLQSYVLARLDGQAGPRWLDGQTLEQTVKAVQMLGVVIAFGTEVTLGSVDRDGWDLAGRVGWDWAVKGEAGLQGAFAKLQASAFSEGKGGQNYFTVFGQLHHWLLQPGVRTDHGPIRDLLRSYIVENMDVCVGRNLYGTPIERRFKYSVQSLSLEAGIHRQTLCKVLVDRGLIEASDADKPNSVLLVDVEEGRRVADMLGNSVQQRQLPGLMNTTLPVVTNLIELDLLTQLHRKSGQTKRAKCGFDRRQVEGLLDRLHELAQEMPDLPGDWVTLTQCTKRARVSEAAQEAEHTCESCGAPCSIRSIDGWLTTVCDDCRLRGKWMVPIKQELQPLGKRAEICFGAQHALSRLRPHPLVALDTLTFAGHCCFHWRDPIAQKVRQMEVEPAQEG